MPYRRASHTFPTMTERHAARRQAAFHALDVSTAIATAQDRSRRQTVAQRLRYYAPVLILMLLLGLAGGMPPNDAHAATAKPYVCPAEDNARWDWSQCGSKSRGVILRSAPRDCKWADGWSARCTTVLSVSEYCHARRAHVIDRKRTRALKGDAYARDHGCTTV